MNLWNINPTISASVDIFADNLKLNMEDAEPETQNEDNYVLEN